jgi:hypothetical protein
VLRTSLAARLRDAGLAWSPRRGDRFVVADRGMDDEVFVLSDMTVEVHELPKGPVIGFNGTTEWALDSIDVADALWLPREDQLRELLGDRFRRLEACDGGVAVVVTSAGEQRAWTAQDAEDAYALALLALLRG